MSLATLKTKVEQLIEKVQSGENLPDKGFVPTERDSNGFPLKGAVYNMTEIPAEFFFNRANSGGHFFKMTDLAFEGDLPSKIGSRAFHNCANINFPIPATVVEVQEGAFYDCRKFNLSNNLNENLEIIGDSAFYYCRGAEKAIIPSTVKTIGSNAFSYCAINEAKFVGKPDTINSRTFGSASSLLDIYVPWAEGEVANAPWGATNATIHYNYTAEV